jgi:hypothetical protein
MPMLKLTEEVRLIKDDASENYYLFCIQTGKHFRLNDVAYEMLKRLSDGKNRIEIVDCIVEHFDIDNSTCKMDLEALLSVLSENNLLINY